MIKALWRWVSKNSSVRVVARVGCVLVVAACVLAYLNCRDDTTGESGGIQNVGGNSKRDSEGKRDGVPKAKHSEQVPNGKKHHKQNAKAIPKNWYALTTQDFFSKKWYALTTEEFYVEPGMLIRCAKEHKVCSTTIPVGEVSRVFTCAGGSSGAEGFAVRFKWGGKLKIYSQKMLGYLEVEDASTSQYWRLIKSRDDFSNVKVDSGVCLVVPFHGDKVYPAGRFMGIVRAVRKDKHQVDVEWVTGKITTYEYDNPNHRGLLKVNDHSHASRRRLSPVILALDALIRAQK